MGPTSELLFVLSFTRSHSLGSVSTRPLSAPMLRGKQAWSQYLLTFFLPSAPCPAVERWLSLGHLPGIKKKTARNIVDMFGTDTRAVLGELLDESLEVEDLRLLEVPGIGPKFVSRMVAKYRARTEQIGVSLGLEYEFDGGVHAIDERLEDGEEVWEIEARAMVEKEQEP